MALPVAEERRKWPGRVRERDQHLDGAAGVLEADPADVGKAALGDRRRRLAKSSTTCRNYWSRRRPIAGYSMSDQAVVGDGSSGGVSPVTTSKAARFFSSGDQSVTPAGRKNPAPVPLPRVGRADLSAGPASLAARPDRSRRRHLRDGRVFGYGFNVETAGDHLLWRTPRRSTCCPGSHPAVSVPMNWSWPIREW